MQGPGPFLLKTEKELASLARDFSRQVHPPCVIFCYGDLGAGKTCFARHFARARGIEAPVTSPTFNLMKEYPLEKEEGRFVHCDLFRLKDESELIEVGILDAVGDQKSIVFIEWPELLDRAGIQPDRVIRIFVQPDDSRRVELVALH